VSGARALALTALLPACTHVPDASSMHSEASRVRLAVYRSFLEEEADTGPVVTCVGLVSSDRRQPGSTIRDEEPDVMRALLQMDFAIEPATWCIVRGLSTGPPRVRGATADAWCVLLAPVEFTDTERARVRVTVEPGWLRAPGPYVGVGWDVEVELAGNGWRVVRRAKAWAT
jgi:hypothetical protein